MNNEISEEAKRTLADLPRRKALQRLERDGATSRPAMQRRILALAAERSIPPADFHKLANGISTSSSPPFPVMKRSVRSTRAAARW
jgi:hypothetical protein